MRTVLEEKAFLFISHVEDPNYATREAHPTKQFTRYQSWVVVKSWLKIELKS